MIKTIFEGRIEKICEVQEFSEKFMKREIVLNSGDEYNPLICIQFVNDKISLCDGLEPGELIKCHLNIISKEYNGKFFTNINCWKIETLDSVASKTQPEQNHQIQKKPIKKVPFPDDFESSDQLPF